MSNGKGKFNLGDVFGKTVELGTNRLIPGGGLISGLAKDVIKDVIKDVDVKDVKDVIVDVADGKDGNAGNQRVHNGNRRMNRRRRAK